MKLISKSLFSPFISQRFFSKNQLRQKLRETLDKEVKENDLVVFMKGTPSSPMCGFSRLVIQILDLNGLDRKSYKSINVLDDDEIREGIKVYSDWPTIPQIYLKGEFIGGSDIMRSLYESGQLQEMLKNIKLSNKSNSS
jgi:monothiol glutaredoxin